MISLYYYRASQGNFGDELNRWLWPRLLPEVVFDRCVRHGEADHAINEAATSLLVGIGTLLDVRLPRRPEKLICGTGAGYGAAPTIDGTWNIRWVRGPLTAELLNIPAREAVTDGAVLIGLTDEKAAVHRSGTGFMPHHATAGPAWRRLCTRAGLIYLDPTADVRSILRRMAGCEAIITEAMHGAIVADTLRIPWAAVTIHPWINRFKWADWCASMSVTYQPTRLPALWPNPPGPVARARRTLKEHVIVRALVRLSRRPPLQLSADDRFADAFGETVSRLDKLRADLRSRREI